MMTRLILVLSLSLLTACVADGKQLVDTDSAQTLENKTLDAPVLSGAVTGTYTLDGTVTIESAALTGQLASTKACGTGYTRLTPNFCIASTTSQQIWTPEPAVTAHYIDSNIPNGSYVQLRLHFKALAGGVTALREMYALFYTDSGGGTQVAESRFSVYEHTTVSVGTVLGEGEDTVIVPISNSGYVYSYDTLQKGNGNTFIDKVSIVGYFD